MIDLAREYIPVDDIMKTIDLLSQSKINTLHLHISDDDSMNLELPSFPGIVEYAALKKN
jgi:hexosaminidase